VTVETKPFGWVRNGYIRFEEPGEDEALFSPPYVPVYDQATVDLLQAKITEYEAILDNYEEQGRRW
jgi:hypothetical protein